MSKKTNLTIERTGTHGDPRGDWEVIGKKSRHIYYRGTRYNCTWQIANCPELRYQEDQNAKEAEETDEHFIKMQKGQEKVMDDARDYFLKR